MYFFDYSNVIDPVLKDVRIFVTALSGAGPGQKIIDICCGTGDQVFYYALKGASATGVDGNAGMLKVAARNAKKRGLQGMDFRLSDAAGLPFADGYFDCASVSLCLHEMEREKRIKTIAEMKRVVKQGGALIFTDFNDPLPKNPVGFFIRAVEYIVGSDNYRCFRSYMDGRGLQGILPANGLKAQKEALLMSRCLHVIKGLNP